jgi:hypothetical protein
MTSQQRKQSRKQEVWAFGTDTLLLLIHWFSCNRSTFRRNDGAFLFTAVPGHRCGVCAGSRAEAKLVTHKPTRRTNLSRCVAMAGKQFLSVKEQTHLTNTKNTQIRAGRKPVWSGICFGCCEYFSPFLAHKSAKCRPLLQQKNTARTQSLAVSRSPNVPQSPPQSQQRPFRP